MGKVVKLEPSTKAKPRGRKRTEARQGRRTPWLGGPSSAASSRQDGARARRRRVTGGVYEIGALRAIDLLATNTSVNQFDVYVGTSAGAFIAALCANGVTPEEMMRVVTRQGRPPFKAIDVGDLLRPNLAEFARKGAMLPLPTASIARQMLSPKRKVSMMDIVVGMADWLPSGAYTGAGIEKYLHEVLSEPGRTDRFSELACELYLTATDLDTCERVVFGAEGPTTCRSQPRSAPLGRSRWSTRRSRSTTAS